MQDIETFLGAGWDFVDEVLNGTCDYWHIPPDGYPLLRYHGGNRPLMPEGLGTAEQPYLIRDARDLGTVWFEPLAHYRLVESVDLSGITWSMAVIPCFGGSFDGNGYVISNLHIQGGSYLGLVGQSGSTASVSNLGPEAIEVSGSGECVGGLVGDNCDGTISSSFWDTQTSAQATSADGTGKTTAEMQTAITFLNAGWDFVGETANGTEDIWWIDEGKDYPRLWWELPTDSTVQANSN
jgi:hypothetical protein